jgi:hypothetical protein
MSRTFPATRALHAALLALALGAAVACEAIVSSDVPEFTCSGSGPSDCPSGSLCDTTVGRCVLDLGGENEAGDGDAGDEDATGVPDAKPDARDSGPAPLGGACALDTDCASRLCGKSAFLTTAIVSAASGVCTQTCCTSGDCPSGFVCFSGGTGGSYCVDEAKAGRTPPTTGGKPAGEACTGSTECRSGLCSNDVCLDTCCLQSDCAAGTFCAVENVTIKGGAAHDIWVCSPRSVSLKNAGTACTGNPQCKNDNCIGAPAVCNPPCCTAADCEAADPSFAGYTCAYGFTTGSDQLKWCFATDSGRAPLNASCAQNLDCQSNYCDPSLKKCLLICCTDDNCGPNEVCRPSPENTPYLRCVPKPTR